MTILLLAVLSLVIVMILQVAVGVIGGMPDIIEAMRMAGKVITL